MNALCTCLVPLGRARAWAGRVPLRRIVYCGWLALLAPALQAAPPAAAPEGSPVVLPEALFRALTSAPGIASDAGLRRDLRALWGGPAAPGSPTWDADCEAARLDSGATPGILRHSFSGGHWLLQIECALGAYQGSFWAAQVWLAQPEAAFAAVLRWPVASAPTAAASGTTAIGLVDEAVVWGELGVVAPAAGQPAQVEIVNRFRALGDCGTRSRYALDHGTTRLVALAALFACADTVADPSPGPAGWPRVEVPDR